MAKSSTVSPPLQAAKGAVATKKSGKSAAAPAKKKSAAPIIQDGTLFNDHFSHIEQLLLARAKVQATSGHNLHKGTPREAFISDFITGHIGAGIGVGTGEVIDARLASGETRNQIDIVLYDQRIPRFDIGANIHLFPVESVKATIEVKSTLQEKDLQQACRAAEHIGALLPQTGSDRKQIRTPRRFLVAYGSTVTLDTIFDWLVSYYKKAELPRADMDRVGLREALFPDNQSLLPGLRSSTLDGIFVFGRGAILFPSFNLPLRQEPLAQARGRLSMQAIQWQIVNGGTGAAHLLFLALMESILDDTLMHSYAKALRFDPITFKEMAYLVKV